MRSAIFLILTSAWTLLPKATVLILRLREMLLAIQGTYSFTWFRKVFLLLLLTGAIDREEYSTYRIESFGSLVGMTTFVEASRMGREHGLQRG